MRRVTIRRSLLRNLSLLVVLTSGAILAVTLIGGLSAVDELSQEQIEITTQRVDAELDTFFGAVRTQTDMILRWSEAGIVNIRDVDRMNRLFEPVLAQHDFLSSLMVANSNGEEYMILRDPIDQSQWTNRMVKVGPAGLEVYIREWSTNSDTVRESRTDVPYDPRTRLWYLDALKATEESPVYWTRPAIFFVTKDPGVTAATHWVDDGAEDNTTIVAVDLLLMDISRFIGALEVTEHGRAFVLFEDPSEGALRVLAFAADEASYTDEDIRGLLTATDSEATVADAVPDLPVTNGFSLPLVDEATRNWDALGRTSNPIKFDRDGKTWWTGFDRYNLGTNSLWIGVAVPEEDFLGDIRDRALIIILAAIAALIAAAVMSTFMARSYSRPLEALAAGSRRLGNLDLTSVGEVSTSLKELEQLAAEQERMRTTLDSFSRYVPVELVRELLSTGEAAKIGGSRRTITALFTDIVGFTTISEALGPEKLTVHMAEYFEAVLEIIQQHSGDVNQLLGDGVLAYWGAPKVDPEHARHAVEGVLECRDRLRELNIDWKNRGLPSLPTHFGLAAGEVVVGNVGSRSRLAYAAVGDTVNLASRLEGLTRFYGSTILSSGRVKDLAGPGFEWMHVDAVRVKGKTEAIELYEPLGFVQAVPSEELEYRDCYEKGRERFLDRSFAEAVEILDSIPEPYGARLTVTRLSDVAASLLADPPDEDWDGVTNFKVK
jgi:adenylate cyclase